MRMVASAAVVPPKRSPCCASGQGGHTCCDGGDDGRLGFVHEDHRPRRGPGWSMSAENLSLWDVAGWAAQRGVYRGALRSALRRWTSCAARMTDPMKKWQLGRADVQVRHRPYGRWRMGATCPSREGGGHVAAILSRESTQGRRHPMRKSCQATRDRWGSGVAGKASASSNGTR